MLTFPCLSQITNGQLNSKDDDLVGTQLAPVVSRLRSYRATASFSGDTSEEVDEDTPSGMGDTRQALPDSILPGLETLQEEHYDQNDVEMQSRWAPGPFHFQFTI